MKGFPETHPEKLIFALSAMNGSNADNQKDKDKEVEDPDNSSEPDTNGDSSNSDSWMVWFLEAIVHFFTW